MMKVYTQRIFLSAFMLLLGACDRQPLSATALPVTQAAITTREAPSSPTAMTMLVPTATLEVATGTPALTPTPQATATATGTPTASPAPTAVPLTMTEEMTFELVAHEGGEVRSVAVDGNIAYVGVGPRLVALDASNPASPQLIGRSEVLPGLVEAVVLESDGQQTRAYAAAGDQVVELALGADGEMTVEGVIAVPGHIRVLALAEGRLYGGGIVRGEDGEASGFVAVVEVQPDTLGLVDVVNLSTAVSALALAENALYVGHFGGLSGILVNNGQLGRSRLLKGANEVYSLQIVGSTLLVGGYMELRAYDISAETGDTLPRGDRLWEIEASEELFLPMIEGIATNGETVYTIGNIPAGNYIPSRLAFPAPESFDAEAAPSASPLVAMNGNHLFVAEGDVLEIYDISRPGELVQVGGYGAPVPTAGDLAIDQTSSGESILYLYDGSPFDTAWERLFSYRLPLLEPLGQLTIEGAERDRAHSVRARFDLALGEAAQHAYLTTTDGVYQINIGNPATPHIEAYEPYAEDELTPLGLVVQGNRVYVATESAESLVTSLAADGALARAGRLDGLRVDAVWAVAGADNKLYLTTSEYGYPERDLLHVVDASDDGLSLLTSLELPRLPGWGTLAADDGVVATAVEGQLLLADVSTPEEPILAARVAPDGRAAYALAFHEGRLFVVAGNQLLVVDVSDFAHPRALGAATLPSAPSYHSVHLAVSDDIVVVAMGEIGVLVFEVGR